MIPLAQSKPVAAPTARSAGFTLVELLTALVILAILLSLAAPSFIRFQRNSELRSAANGLLTALSSARIEAMKRGTRVYVQPAADENWAAGWKMYYLEGKAPDLTESVLATGPALPATVKQDNAVSSLLSGMAFDPNGVPVNVKTGNRISNGSVYFFNDAARRGLVVAMSGRMRVCDPEGQTTCKTD